MMSLTFKEGVKIPPPALNEVISAANQDIRQVIHNLSMWSVSSKAMDYDQVKRDAAKATKDIKLVGGWSRHQTGFSQVTGPLSRSHTSMMHTFLHVLMSLYLILNRAFMIKCNVDLVCVYLVITCNSQKKEMLDTLSYKSVLIHWEWHTISSGRRLYWSHVTVIPSISTCNEVKEYTLLVSLGKD